MDVSSFFSRLVQPAKAQGVLRPPDDPDAFDAAWSAIKGTLEHPDERQIVRGIATTDVPRHLQHLVDALVYENSSNNGDETGACFEYLIRNDLLSNLVKLAEPDRPHGIKGEVVRSINNLIVLLSDRFLNHNAVHAPLRRLLRSCVGDGPAEGQPVMSKRVFGAAGMDSRGKGPRDEEAEADLVDLMCTLCSKMRAYPPLLLIFFHDKVSTLPGTLARPDHLLSRTLSPTPSGQTSLSHPSRQSISSKGGQQRFEFLLFSYLLRFVHREGRTGDFARAGLLFLFDIAFLPVQELIAEATNGQDRKGENEALQDAQDALGEYILDGDFAAVMAAAVGAVYSLLPSKLRVPSLAEQAGGEDGEGQLSGSGGLYLGASTSTEPKPDLPCTTDPDVRSQLDLLLKLFAFLQDIITRCSSSVFSSSSPISSNTHLLGAAVADSTLDAIHSSFLDNILYPSILESSASDGTAVAVLTYLHVVLSTIDDGPLLTRLLHFLLDTDSDEGPRLAPHHQPKRGSKVPAVDGNGGHRADYFVDMGKFTMKDLILDNFSAAHPASRTAALQLLQTMLQEHCYSTVDGLLSTTRLVPTDISSQSPYPPEVNLYSSLLSTLHHSSTPFELSPAYAAYLVDVQSAIQSDRCFRLDQLDETLADEAERAEIARAKRKCVAKHALSPGDGMIVVVLAGLAGWMGRTPDENVVLASVVISLAGCSRRCVDGWLTMSSEGEADPWGTNGTAATAANDDPFTIHPPSHPPPPSDRVPALYQILSSHTAHISQLRTSIPSFDTLLSARRHALLFVDNLDDATALNLENDAFGSVPMPPGSPGGLAPPATPAKKRASLARSITGFFSPRKKTPSGASPGVGSGVGSGLGTPTKIGAGDGASGLGVEPGEGRTDEVGVEIPVAAKVTASPWAVETPRRPRANRTISEWSGEDGVGSPSFSSSRARGRGGGEARGRGGGDVQDEGEARTVGLDQILDNVVILEEFLKEIVAVITARRALRIDSFRPE